MVLFANRAVVPEHVLVHHLDGESVFLNLNSEKYFGLDAVGTRMFVLATASPCIESAYKKLLEEYEAEPAVLRDDLADLLSRLVDNGPLDVLLAMWERFRRFNEMDPEARKLFIRAAVLLPFVGISLRTRGYKKTQAWFAVILNWTGNVQGGTPRTSAPCVCCIWRCNFSTACWE